LSAVASRQASTSDRGCTCNNLIHHETQRREYIVAATGWRPYLLSLGLWLLFLELQLCGEVFAGKVSKRALEPFVLLCYEVLSEQLYPEVLRCWVRDFAWRAKAPSVEYSFSYTFLPRC